MIVLKVCRTSATIMAMGLLSVALKVAAQEMTLGVELRPRAEYRSGYKSPITEEEDPAGFMLQRSRFTVGFKNAYLKSCFTVQDARTFGQSNISSEAMNSAGALSVYEAWADVTLMPGASVKIGRQTLVYDDKRLFSDSKWSNTGKSHDAVVFKYSLSQLFDAHLAFAYNNDKAISKETLYSGASTYRYLGFLWLSKPITSGWLLTAVALDDAFQGTSVDASGKEVYGKKVNMYHRYTVGGNLKYQQAGKPFFLYATSYFQFGKSASAQDLNAYLLALKMSYKFTPSAELTLGTDYYSGGDGSDSSKSKTFNWMYGAPHGFNGYMDYWSASLPVQGLIDMYGQLGGSLNSKIGYEANFHVFATAKQLEYGGSKKGRKLGSELDLKLVYKMNPSVTVEGGWSSYFLSDNSRYLKLKSADASSRAPGWAYLMLTIKPDLIKIKL